MIRGSRSVECAAAGSAGAVLLATTVVAGRGHVSALEERAFCRCNEGREGIRVAAWVVSQTGALASVYVVGGGVARRSGWRAAVPVVVAGTAAWVAGKALKRLVRRGRPAELLRGVRVRGQPQRGDGFPSGHAAVATTLAIVAAPSCPWRAAALAVSGLTGWTRMYLGAHLPLDVVGGHATGVLIGVIARRVASRS